MLTLTDWNEPDGLTLHTAGWVSGERGNINFSWPVRFTSVHRAATLKGGVGTQAGGPWATHICMDDTACLSLTQESGSHCVRHREHDSNAEHLPFLKHRTRAHVWSLQQSRMHLNGRLHFCIQAKYHIIKGQVAGASVPTQSNSGAHSRALWSHTDSVEPDRAPTGRS